MIRGDLSNCLVHLTKGTTSEDAVSNFMSIIQSGRLRGGNGHIRGGYNCVCFSEAPISVLAQTSVIAPATIRWVGFSHFEADECGALNEWIEIAPHATPVCSFVGAMVSVNDFADRPARPLSDGEVL